MPHTLGHEGSGTVLEVGPGVTKVVPGDRVVVTWLKGDGADVPSTQYGSEAGPVNSGAVSTFIRRAVISENRLVPIPQHMPLREAALLGCAIPTGGGIVLNTMKVDAGDSVAVFGVGGIGLSAVLTASMCKADKIIAIDICGDKLAHAGKMGATHTIDASTEGPLEKILQLTDGKGVDFAIEAAGITEVMETALKSVRTGGGLCVLAGNPAMGKTIAIDPFDLIQGRNIKGSWGGESDSDRDILRYAQWHLTGNMPLSGLITHEYSLDQINQAFADLESGKLGRGIVDMSLGATNGET